MKKAVLIVLLTLSTLALSQADPRLIATPDGFTLRPGTTQFSGLLGDLFTQNIKLMLPSAVASLPLAGNTALTPITG